MEKIKNVRRYVEEITRSKFGEKCIGNGKPIAAAFEKALKK